MQNLPVVGALMQSVPWVRDRLLADHRFLFKVVAEIVIDSGEASSPGSTLRHASSPGPQLTRPGATNRVRNGGGGQEARGRLLARV
jgi:hypothetical protein